MHFTHQTQLILKALVQLVTYYSPIKRLVCCMDCVLLLRDSANVADHLHDANKIVFYITYLMYYIMYAPAESVSNLNCTSHLRLCRCYYLLIPTSSPSPTLPSPRPFTWLVHTPPQSFSIPSAKSRKLQVPLTCSCKCTELAVCTCMCTHTHTHTPIQCTHTHTHMHTCMGVHTRIQ